MRRLNRQTRYSKPTLAEFGPALRFAAFSLPASVAPAQPTRRMLVSPIAQCLSHPTFYQPGVVSGPGLGNPPGMRWLGLNIKGFGIHGTNRPASAGKNASHSCMRLKNSDGEDLFACVRVGDRGSLLAKRIEEPRMNRRK